MLKAIFSIGLLAALATGLVLPPVENPVLAQAPTGPQGGSSPRQQNPTPPQAAPGTAQQPPQAGVTIAVDVPIVTLDVVATTQHGDNLPLLKNDTVRIPDARVPLTTTNFAPTPAPITLAP